MPHCSPVLDISTSQGGAQAPPDLHFCSQPVRLTRLLGRGATSCVYACDALVDGMRVECAAKVLQPPYSVEQELSVLHALHAGDCSDGIPTVLGRLDEGQGFLLQLLGASLASDDADQYVPLVFNAMEPLLQLLKQVRKGTVFGQDLLGSHLVGPTAEGCPRHSTAFVGRGEISGMVHLQPAEQVLRACIVV